MTNPRAAPGRILIVDDSEDSADITAAYLAEGGFSDVAIAGSAKQAYQALGIDPSVPESAAATFDLVVMDIMMPDVDGIEACAFIRLHPASRHMPVLMLSAARDVELLNQAFVAGADDFVGKPVSQVDLLARARTLLRFKRERERRQAREAELEQRHRDLQAASLDSTLIDPLTRLTGAPVIDLTLRNCIDQGEPACLALIQVDEFSAYIGQHGADAAERLVQHIAGAVAAAPGPLAALLSYYAAGAFMIVHPRADDDAAMTRTCEIVRRDIAELGIVHGNSIHRETVTVSTAIACGDASALDTLPARLLAEFELHLPRGNGHVRIT